MSRLNGCGWKRFVNLWKPMGYQGHQVMATVITVASIILSAIIKLMTKNSMIIIGSWL